MADVFISYAHTNREKVRPIANGLIEDGRTVWWDERLQSSEAFGMRIEDEIDASRRVLVAWSKASRRSIWVFGEALKALDDAKLVQVTIDDGKLPVPFNALHAIDFSVWNGRRDAEEWEDLREHMDGPIRVSHHRVVAALGTLTKRSAVPAGHAAAGLLTTMGSIVAMTSVLALRTELITANTFAASSILAAISASAGLMIAVAEWLRTDTSVGQPDAT